MRQGLIKSRNCWSKPNMAKVILLISFMSFVESTVKVVKLPDKGQSD
jgi:hypothetical protein